MNATQIKMCVLCWFRFKKKWNHIATEVGGYNADVVGANNKYLYEVEVKVNFKDFLADFEKQKHKTYKSLKVNNWRALWIPNKFFFAVPEDLVKETLSYLREYHPDYGLLTVKWESWWHSPVIHTVMQAKFLHKKPVSKKALDLILHRMSSEICGHYIKNEAQNNASSHMTKLVKKLVRVERKRDE